MKKVSISDVYSNSIISEDSSWSDVHNKLNELADSYNDSLEVSLDGVIIGSSYNSQVFLNMVYEPKLYFTVTNNKELCDSVRVACILEGIETNKIRNIVVENKKEVVKKVDQAGIDEIKGLIKVKSGTAYIMICDMYSQLGSLETADNIKDAILQYDSMCGWSNYILQCKDLPIIDNVMKRLAEIKIELSVNNSIEFDIESNSKEYLNKLDMYVYKCSSSGYSLEHRRQFMSNVPVGTCGILVRYKSSKAIDEFGRHGNGKPVSSKMAIFRGFTDNGSMLFEEYSQVVMFTKTHWSLEHDCENAPYEKLPYKEVICSLEELGAFDKFVGSQYHFLLPVQEHKSENICMNSFDNDGNMVATEYTIPERMKEVFSDWNVDYYEAGLDSAIRLTKARLLEEENINK